MTGSDREGFAAFLLRMRGLGIDSRDLMTAFETTPRRSFVPTQWHADSWSQGMLPIECGEAIEGVDLQARVLASLDLQPGQKVLEIGTGSGYTAAVMSRLVARVITLDRYRTLIELASQRLEVLELSNVLLRQADGRQGLAAEGPFDRIVVWAAYAEHPRHLVDQLSTGGIAVAPIGPAEGEQALAKLSKVGSRFEREELGRVRLQPLAEGMAASI
ncbi:protein-L-isoaspartate(D-aspartate) O-methyltransferase [Chelativorans sp. ZYF759]|uniref:protein-L-isoaspartate(D-aspartate) O-methyltransferase n=1 Tax=Chelativorans sp. ZYF759 TaxID=2692213 RepID=UPI00145D62C3|nr:protein-L-isoaspartate(D-aspartate) O-methyltransferase [Chelativorans sp. ZYF759]NMG38567.1 protein-L-isoaspartate(D-aspartate) O-methyltransferase [Chelativorans sp. ZYF759]